MIGRTLGHFRITAKLGEGGMGEVWRAEDTRLRREVAIKVLPAAFTEDAERLARFEREAQLLAQLHHPHIASIFGLEESDSGIALVLELVEGPTLAERIEEGPLPLEEALAIAGEIAEALEVAHEKGIVHRDLKPQNVKIATDGKVKVLDFGLAKALDPATGADSAVDLGRSPTLTLGGSLEGVILGTAAYMAPEQAKGQAADKRADIWAFGVVLYEMLVGTRLFGGDSVPETLAGVLKTEIDLTLLPTDLPPSLVRVLRRCLTRDPRRRLRDIGDARLEIAEAGLEEPSRAVSEPPQGSRRRELAAWAVAILAVLGALGLTFRPEPAIPESPQVRFEISLPEEHLLNYGDAEILALSEDGSQLAFAAATPSGERMIYVRALDDPAIRPVAGSEGGTNPVFSPDGDSLAFFVGKQLVRIPVAGGTAVPLAEAPNPRGAVWSGDGSILYSPAYAAGLWRVPASGGTPQVVVEPDASRNERTYRWPDLLPDGRTVIATVGFSNSPNSYENAEIAAVSLTTGERVTLIKGASMARFVPPDQLLFARRQSVLAVSLDLDRLAVRGDPVPVLDGVGGEPGSGVVFLTVAANGSLAYVPGSISAGRAFVTIVERDGEATRLPLPAGQITFPRFSPDGTQIALSIGRNLTFGNAGAIWLFSFETEVLSRVTFGGDDIYPAFSPDGRWLAYLRSGSGIFRRPTDGRGDAELLQPDQGGPALPESWSPDGRTLAVTNVGSSTDIRLQEVGGDWTLFEKNAASPAFSPDGRWIAYHAPAGGNSSVFVRPVEGEGKWQVSRQQGAYPRWGPEGKELYYIDIGVAERSLVQVAIEAGETISVGPPVVLVGDLSQRYATAADPGNAWDATRDGRRFAFIEPEQDESARGRISLLLNWRGRAPNREPR